MSVSATLYGRIAAGAALGPLRRRPDALPERELRRDGVTVDRRRLAAYDRVCGFRLRDTLPATYPHVLAFPLTLELMAAGDFPFGALGLVHVANAIEQLRPLGADESLDLRVWVENLAEHPRGRTVDLVAEASVGGEVAWRDRSTYLRREGGGERDRRERGGVRPTVGGEHARSVAAGSDPRSVAAGSDPTGGTAEWRVPGDVGRRYAAVSGDRNPIHLHGLAAKLFGQKGAIAHGMWTKARCLAALEPQLPDAFTVDVAFTLPLLLPATVAFAAWPERGGRRFALRDAGSGKPHLVGLLAPVRSTAAVTGGAPAA